MPMIEPASVISDAPARAMPKSATFALPASSSITFCGFRSRWTTPRRWAKLAARRICTPMSITRVWSSGPCSSTTSFSVRPGRYSIAM